MTTPKAYELYPIEITTHNLYFHEEASIFSIDSFEDLISTGGGDKLVRLWKVSETDTKIEGDFKYTTALNSSLKLTYICDISGHEKTVNCVRFSREGILASASDNGKVILYFKGNTHLLRKSDGLDCYELAWGPSKLIIGISSGTIEIYEIVFTDYFETRLVSSFTPHNDIVQGLAFNDKYSIFLSVSKDKTAKLFKDTLVLEEYTEFQNLPLFAGGHSFFRRICFNKSGDRAYLCNVRSNSVLVLKYPFKIVHWIYKLGPFNSEVVKILEDDSYLFIFTRTSLYIYREDVMVACVDNICFKSVTDATVSGSTIYISSLDGFVSSFRYTRK